jgi:hypothetical protein
LDADISVRFTERSRAAIKTGPRRVIEYLLSPLTEASDSDRVRL